MIKRSAFIIAIFDFSEFCITCILFQVRETRWYGIAVYYIVGYARSQVFSKACETAVASSFKFPPIN
jgi:hypothetical protein